MLRPAWATGPVGKVEPRRIEVTQAAGQKSIETHTTVESG